MNALLLLPNLLVGPALGLCGRLAGNLDLLRLGCLSFWQSQRQYAIFKVCLGPVRVDWHWKPQGALERSGALFVDEPLLALLLLRFLRSPANGEGVTLDGDLDIFWFHTRQGR